MSGDELAARLAGLPDRHKSPGRLMREARAARRCDVPGCDELGALMARGVRCPDHRPAQPVPGPPVTVSAPVDYPLPYGTASTDPAGRNGDGWELGKSTRLPTWHGDGPEQRRGGVL